MLQFGRIKKKFRGKSKKDTENKEEPVKVKNDKDDFDEEDDDDEDGDLSKYKLDVRFFSEDCVLIVNHFYGN